MRSLFCGLVQLTVTKISPMNERKHFKCSVDQDSLILDTAKGNRTVDNTAILFLVVVLLSELATAREIDPFDVKQ